MSGQGRPGRTEARAWPQPSHQEFPSWWQMAVLQLLTPLYSSLGLAQLAKLRSRLILRGSFTQLPTQKPWDIPRPHRHDCHISFELGVFAFLQINIQK